jgi:2-polyprenyl-3-methyl-5-hydroxy-6-metoxy-1,4-benzoquinol methylase
LAWILSGDQVDAADQTNMETNHSPSMPAPETLSQLDVGICEVAILRAALELEVWAKVAAGGNSVDLLAAAEHWNPLGTRMLLDDLCKLRLLAREGGQYRLVPEAEHYLLPNKPTYRGRALLANLCWESGGRLAEAIRTGRRPVGFDATTAEAVDIWIGTYSDNWAAPDTYLKDCDVMWQALGINGRRGLQVLDLACGPAPKSLALALADPGVRVTLLDWERILQVAHEVATGLGISKQVTFISGDLINAAYGDNRYEVAFLGNVTYFFSPEQNICVFRKLHDALADNGTLVLNAIRGEDFDPVEYGLWFYSVSPGGIYNFEEYKDMLERAGFTNVAVTNIEDLSMQPIKATKLP